MESRKLAGGTNLNSFHAFFTAGFANFNLNENCKDSKF